MNSLLIIILFLFSFFIFFVNNIFILLLLFLLFCILMLSLKVKIRNIKSIFFLSLTTFLINIPFSNFVTSFITSYRLILIYMLVMIITDKLSILGLSKGISKLFRIIKRDTKTIELIISLSLTYLLIMNEEAKELKLNLINKNFKFNLKNLFTKPHLFVITFINNIFYSIDELELVLISKGYQSI